MILSSPDLDKTLSEDVLIKPRVEFSDVTSKTAARREHHRSQRYLCCVGKAEDEVQELPSTPVLRGSVVKAVEAVVSWASTAASSKAPSYHRVLTIDDLEPVDSSGRGIKAWRQARPWRGPLPSSLVQHVPKEAVIGQGCYGIVWRAKATSCKDFLAVKNIRVPGGNPILISRECSVAGLVMEQPHPCLVKVFGVHTFDDSDLCSLILEFCPGGDLQQRIQSCRLAAEKSQRSYESPGLARPWLGQIYLGLCHLHRLDVLLRDLKPENVIFDSSDVAKITDFGFGRFGLESQGTWSFGAPTGTAGYVAPEVLVQEQYDHRADLYSFGVLMWVLLTGGVKGSDMPRPPTAEVRHVGDFDVLREDWQRLQAALKDTKLDPVALDLIQHLTHRHPSDRLDHEGVRNHEYLAELQLPDEGMDVHAWALDGVAAK